MPRTTHELLVQAMMDYYNTQTRFEAKGFDETGRKARSILSDIRKLATERRNEIQAKRKALKVIKKANKQESQNQDTQD
jgi:vacuolar-type H+-ATPase subunit C/Vma6|tara:strand:+ start:2619 stop:2855 length:237 start_codon:yes stop_codon:yes gene_type:complete